MAIKEESLMSRVISGIIRWLDDPLYSAVTPIQEIHATEISEYLKKIDDDLVYHKSLRSYDAHAAVNIVESGFITPELVAEIEGLDARIDALIDKAKRRLPPGLIVIWNELTSNIPDGWHWCNGEATTPDTRGKFVVMGYPGGTKFPLHSYGENEQSLIGNLPAHTHTFFNGFHAENYYDWNPWKTPYGLSVGDSGENDWDNSWAYLKDTMDYAGTDTSSTNVDINPFHIKKPFMMKALESPNTYTVEIIQPKFGTITVNNSTTSPLMVPEGTIITAALVTGPEHQVNSFTINGENRETPCYIVVAKDIVITADVEERWVNVTVKQNSISKTYINDNYGTNFSFLYSTRIKISTDSTNAYKAIGYTIETPDGKTVQVANMRALMTALYANSDDKTDETTYTPPFLESAFDLFNAHVSLGKTATRQDTKSIVIDENEEVLTFVQTTFWTNFYGSRNSSQKAYVYLKIDGITVATKEITYVESGEYTLQVFNADYKLTKGEHKFTLAILAKSVDTNLDIALTSNTITLTHTGKIFESEEAQ